MKESLALTEATRLSTIGMRSQGKTCGPKLIDVPARDDSAEAFSNRPSVAGPLELNREALYFRNLPPFSPQTREQSSATAREISLTIGISLRATDKMAPRKTKSGKKAHKFLVVQSGLCRIGVAAMETAKCLSQAKSLSRWEIKPLHESPRVQYDTSYLEKQMTVGMFEGYIGPELTLFESRLDEDGYSSANFELGDARPTLAKYSKILEKDGDLRTDIVRRMVDMKPVSKSRFSSHTLAKFYPNNHIGIIAVPPPFDISKSGYRQSLSRWEIKLYARRDTSSPVPCTFSASSSRQSDFSRGS
ncbi:hypothetical protein IWZ01DRAFT_487133 [Phyllosticta capitalensis]